MVNVKYICDGKNIYSAKYETFNVMPIGRKVKLKNSSNLSIYVVKDVYDVLYMSNSSKEVNEQNIVVELNFVEDAQYNSNTSY